MAGAVIQRLLSSLLVIAGASFLVFFILYLLPGDPVLMMLAGTTFTPEAAANLRHQLGLDQSALQQFLRFAGGLLQGDFGKSLVSDDPVLPKILSQFPATAALTLAGTLIAVVFGIWLGVLSAVHRGGIIDLAARLVSLLGISMPTFWSGILLILIFSVQLNWFPALGSDGWRTLVLPAAALGLVGSGFIVRMVRNSMLEVMNEPFITTLRAKGLPERLVMYRHALRSALIPALTIIGIQIGELLAGAVVIETVFSRQGIGRLLAGAITAKDLPVVQGVIFFTAMVYVAVNLLVDLSYTLIDPRVRRTQ
ncbi:ABC transporter permease [Paenibacillus mucilaginosus]|uniref:Binding-protein-dependent transport systems inner membrane component n=3 Tax=Paenibacillus mucilaginosus TaxID=61624 RepID=H6NPW1_9BACL|nr:ABC transporter permease [Paenibacillus mucilaginosus]AEI43511.1 binding-protein-dependent transport systems inner membrane component [Paenibacillus mucilaginosus KNP414]AFC31152.1 binding-protein-dependent transport systems inner membrane component [Paenibacillus mucilaginosus 3016]AFH63474.1 glutathione ABC transporter permease [Paenibacillus mucilaginosus K02]MCG7211947.1 ABC transporter permease [Paenibacillus mucilaginosus]WDM25059.1 ABC transporter permease [Paenibacillus mucilaginosu